VRLSWIANTVLVLALVVSALGVVKSVWRNRTLFAELQQLREQRDELNVQWGKLKLEQSTWSTRARIQQVARKKLDMHMPRKVQRVVVKP
jgi:cell division protein FtsL